MTKFQIHPRVLAEALDNAVVIGKDKPTITFCEYIAITARSEGLYLYGRGRYTAGRMHVPMPLEDVPAKAVSITEAEASELASVLRKIEGAGRKGTVVLVELAGGLKVSAGPEVLCDLEDADPDGWDANLWDEIDTHIYQAESVDQHRIPLAFSKDLLAKFTKIKAETDVLDLVCIGGYTVLAKMGANFYGFVEAVGREGYAKGGPWADGPGRPEHLLGWPITGITSA